MFSWNFFRTGITAKVSKIRRYEFSVWCWNLSSCLTSHDYEGNTANKIRRRIARNEITDELWPGKDEACVKSRAGLSYFFCSSGHLRREYFQLLPEPSSKNNVPKIRGKLEYYPNWKTNKSWEPGTVPQVFQGGYSKGVPQTLHNTASAVEFGYFHNDVLICTCWVVLIFDWETSTCQVSHYYLFPKWALVLINGKH